MNKNIVKNSKSKLFCAIIILAFAMLSPLLIPFVTQLNLSTSLKATLSGLLLFGIPEIGILLAIILLGQEGFSWLKSRVFFWIKQTLLPKKISRLRHLIGITLFSATLIIGFLIPYIGYFSSKAIQRTPSYYIFVLDLLFFTSFFILGGNFWEKLKRLFIYEV